MLCQYCNKQQATTHIKRSINGQTSEIFVCSECAKKHGIGIGYKTMNVNDLFGGLFSHPVLKDPDEGQRCPQCNISFREIVKTGKVGCPECYVMFYEKLQPSIQRIHGMTTHIGKHSAAPNNDEISVKSELATLKEELKQAVEAQEYERCAQLRDRIRELEGENHG